MEEFKSGCEYKIELNDGCIVQGYVCGYTTKNSDILQAATKRLVTSATKVDDAQNKFIFKGITILNTYTRQSRLPIGVGFTGFIEINRITDSPETRTFKISPELLKNSYFWQIKLQNSPYAM